MELAGHTIKAFDEQLNHIMGLILKMGEQVQSQVAMARRALTERTESLVEEVRRQDKMLNQLERDLEQAAISTIALQNPMAGDLRFIASAMKISSMLERAGDLAKNNIKRSANLGNYGKTETFANLTAMADIVQRMLADAMIAVKNHDDAKALEVWKQDDEVDDLYHAVFTSMQQEMHADSSQSEACTHILFIAKNFERMADYVTDLAKTVHYTVTGEAPTKDLIRSGKK